MIVFTTEDRDGVAVVRLHGPLDVDEVPTELAGRLEAVGGDGPLLVDLSEATPIPGPGVGELLARLEVSRRRSATVLVHDDLDARRALRSLGRQLPVVPDVASGLSGHFPAALAPRRSAPALG